MNCQFCNREFKNAGGLGAHEPYCKFNPNRVKRKRSPDAGAKKGVKTWNSGKKFADENIQRSVEFFEQCRHNDCVEPVARRHAKRLLIHQKGNLCDVCGITEWLGQPVPLVCDHINGDSTDNRLENFRNICCNCDAQLPTFKSKNRGRGRKYDRERYQGGASR